MPCAASAALDLLLPGHEFDGLRRTADLPTKLHWNSRKIEKDFKIISACSTVSQNQNIDIPNQPTISTFTTIMSLSGKNVIVTGATSGIGVQIAKNLSDAGASVFIGGRRAEKGEQVAKEVGGTFHTVDVANDESNKAFFNAAEKHFGGQNVDFILLNAGVEGNNEDTVVTSLNIETYDYIYAVNVRGMMLGLRYGTELLREKGTFLITSSVGSILPLPTNPVYASSKAALDSLVRSYAAQFAGSEDKRIKSLSIVAINPTMYETEMTDRFAGGSEHMANLFAKMLNPCQRPGKADELARVVKAFVQGELPYQSGDVFVADAETHFPISEYTTRMQEATTKA